jgi:signal transduction histidine kinase
MIPYQLAGATFIFLDRALSRPGPEAMAIAAYLAFLVLAVTGLAFPGRRAGIPLAAAKALLCLLAAQSAPLCLLLIPAIGLELPSSAGKDRILSLPLAAFSLGLCAPAFFVSPSLRLPYASAWLLGAVAAAQGRLNAVKALRLRARAQGLERALAESEEKKAALEKSSATQELLVKFQERDSIAQRLHDSLGHAMTGSIMQLEAAGLVSGDDPERARALVGKAAEALKRGLAEIRESLAALKPEAGTLGLQKIRGMLDDFESAHGRRAVLSAQGDLGALGAAAWIAIQDNLREALTNHLRHSRGKSFSCSLEAMNKLTKVEFKDSGGPVPAFKPGMGLEGMEKRTREAGGTLIVDGSRGFSVIMLFRRGE